MAQRAGFIRTAGALTALVCSLTLVACGHTPSVAQDPGTSVPPPSSAPTSAPPTSAPPTSAPPTSAPPSTPAGSPSPSGSGGSSTPPQPPVPPKPPKAAAVLERGDAGRKVRELQHRLRQLDWFTGRITGKYETSTVKGVKGFQGKRKLPVTGSVDATTWKRLRTMTQTPTTDELNNKLVAGPALFKQGSTGNGVRDVQVRLRQIGWFSGDITGFYGSATAASVRGFQAKRAIPVTGQVDQRTLTRLRAMTRTPTNDELHNRFPRPSAAGLDARCLTDRALCVSKRNNSLTWVVNGKAVLRVDVRFGSYETPTREGSFRVGWKSRHHVSTIYHTPMPYAMFFSGGQAVHYSPDFAARGYSGASHGCVNVRNLSAIRWLFDQVRVGDKVIVYR